jgi:hypothetical protein
MFPQRMFRYYYFQPKYLSKFSYEKCVKTVGMSAY